MNDTEKINILIIDNHISNEIDFSGIFNESKFKIYLSDGIENGLEIAARYLPHIIICSITGFDAGRKLIINIYNEERTRFLPVIYISSSVWDKNEFRAIMDLGAADFFPADFKSEDLVKSVQRRVAQRAEFKTQIMETCQRAFETENLTKKDHILITVGKRLQLVKYDQIVCISAEKEYSKIRTVKGKAIIVRKSLKSWLEILPPNDFLRIHRQNIINVNSIEKIEKTKSRSYVVYLKTLSKPLELSRRYSAIMRKTFSGKTEL